MESTGKTELLSSTSSFFWPWQLHLMMMMPSFPSLLPHMPQSFIRMKIFVAALRF
jgi:hypothetical protein